jgi:hypothetical protein
VAREDKDNSSLLFSLAWLHQYGKRAITQETIEIAISPDEGLTYLKAKAKETNLPPLLSFVALIDAAQLIRSVRLVVFKLINI